ncbi:MAG TPA: hypothetical protein VKI44_08935 [Acetobacteraceae bacterium]|nr:hypothetical protein [Acetobacteraceae bacterium]
MTLYRVYFVDRAGPVHSAEDIECASDAAALTTAAKPESAYPVVEV